MDTTPASLLVRLRRPDELLPPDQLREQRQAWQRAWADFVELYTPLLYGCARRNGLQRADADDLVAAVLGHLVRKMEEFQYDRRRGRFRDWLAVVLQNKWRELRRRRRIQRHTPSWLRRSDPTRSAGWPATASCECSARAAWA
jgi:DNA-directed RNA polymerase specialized sigma24 family protein